MDYKKIYNQVVKRAKTRKLEGYKEKHHVIPKCVKEDNSKTNIVELTAREHFLCHLLLCEIYPENIKLKQALWLMAIGKRKNKTNIHKPSSRTYERLKIDHSNRLKGTKHTKETRDKISKSKLGMVCSDETKKKMSESRKGHKMYDDEWREKISNSLKGGKRTQETKDKMSKLRVGVSYNIIERTIEQYDLQGNFIKEWDRAYDAARSLNKLNSFAINETCRGIRKSIYGYIWKYKN